METGISDIFVVNYPSIGAIRSIIIDGVQFWNATDVAKSLGYSNPRKTIRDHCPDAILHPIQTTGGIQQVKFIPESNLLRLISRSKMTGAAELEKWIYETAAKILHKSENVPPFNENSLNRRSPLSDSFLPLECQSFVPPFDSRSSLSNSNADAEIIDVQGTQILDSNVKDDENSLNRRSPLSDVMSPINFLHRIFHNADQNFFTYIWTRTNENQRKRTNSFKLSEIDSLLKIAQNLNQNQLNVSFSMGLLDHPLGTYQRAKSVDIIAIPCLWIDIDVANPVHGQSQKLVPSIEEAIQLLPKELPPSIIVNSGYGIHAYWIFSEMFKITSEFDRKRAKSMLERLQSIIRSNAGEYFIDPTADLSRMLRLPGTINWKSGNKNDAPVCKVIEASDKVFDLNEIELQLQPRLKEINPRQISKDQMDYLSSRNDSTTNLASNLDPAEKLFENCSFCRYCKDNIESLSHPDFVNFFPNLLQASDGREIAIELCRRRFSTNFDESKTQMHIDSLKQLKPITCERISTLYPQHCNSNSCIVHQLGKKSPCAILISPQVKRAINPDTVGEIFPNAPESIRDLKIPNGFSLKKTRIVDERGKIPKAIINTPVVISRVISYADNDKPAFYELTYLSREKWRTCIAKPNVISDAKSLVTTLPGEGILVSSKQSGAAGEFFNSFIEINQNAIPSIKMYQKLGWHGAEFILPSLNKGEYLIEDPMANEKIKRAGDREISIEILREISKYPFARLLVDANFAATLVEKVDCRNFLIDLIATSSSGKSMALQFANSMWGAQNWMANFNATTNAAEEFATARNSLPTNVNEWQMTDAKRREEIANQIVHRFSEGEGRARLNRDGTPKPTKSWHGILITTSEQELTAENAFQGVKTRTLEIRADTVIGYKNKHGKLILDQRLCKKILNKTKRNFGHLGAEFIEKLKEEFQNDMEFKDLLNESLTYFDFVMNLRNNEILTSYAEYIAVLACAHYRVDKYFLEKSDAEAMDSTLKFIDFLAKLLPTNEEISDIHRAKSSIIDWIQAYIGHFTPWNDYTEGNNQIDGIPQDFPKFKIAPKDPIYGFWLKDELYVNPSELKRVLAERGFSAQKIIKEWAMNGDIEVSADKKNLSIIKKDADGNPKRVIGLSFIHEFEIAENQENAPSNEDIPLEKIPF